MELFILSVSALSLPFGLELSRYRLSRFYASAITGNESKQAKLLNIFEQLYMQVSAV